MQGPVSGRRISRRMMRTIIITACVALVIIAAVIGGNIFMEKMAEERAQERKAETQATSASLSSTVADPLLNVVTQVRQLAGSPGLVTLFKGDDPAALEERATALSSEITAAMKVRLLRPGEYAIDRESNPPLGYASLDMLRQAENTDSPVPLEIHNYGSDSSHIVLIERVTDEDGSLLGLMHASLSPDHYLQPGKLDVNNGYAEVVQLTGGAPLILARVGDSKYKHGDPVSNPVTITRWQVRYWPESSAVATPVAGADGGIPLIPVVLVLILLAGGLVYMRRRQAAGESTGEDSNVVFGGAIKAIQEGVHPGLEKLLPNLPGLGRKKPVKPVSQGLEGDDITHVADPGAVKAAAKDTPPGAGDADSSARETATEEEQPVATGRDSAQAPEPEKEEEAPPVEVSAVIFRAYDIRGVVDKDLSADVVRLIGRAIGTEAIQRGQQGLVVGRDGRNSSEELSSALIEGLRASGADVIDIGMVPTPVLYFATHHLETASGVMLTGSHNGPEYNGLKIVLDGETLSGEAIQAIRNRIEAGDLASGSGSLQTADIMSEYIRTVSEDIPVALGNSFKVVVDCGNGVASIMAPQLYRAIGHDVIELYCEVDGNFPNHHPDPGQPENLQALIDAVKENGADLGMAFDGDGDRLGVVDCKGNIVWPDRLMMLFARDVLSRNAGQPIIFDVKCSRYLKAIIEMSGGKPVMWKTGHSLIKNKMQEINAPLAGEMSGHIFFSERWYGFDDALYAGARLLEILTASKEKPEDVFADLPGGIATPEMKIPLPEKYHEKFMQALKKKAGFEGAEINDIDGLRVDFSDRWGLIRPSNTTPCLVVRFEAEDDASMEKIKSEFRELIQSVTRDLKLPF